MVMIQGLINVIGLVVGTIISSQGNFVMFQSSIPSLELTSKMLDEGVMVRPGDNFGAPGCIRLTIGTQEANERFWDVFSSINSK